MVNGWPKVPKSGEVINIRAEGIHAEYQIYISPFGLVELVFKIKDKTGTEQIRRTTVANPIAQCEYCGQPFFKNKISQSCCCKDCLTTKNRLIQQSGSKPDGAISATVMLNEAKSEENMKKAPIGAYYVWYEKSLKYPKFLASKLSRKDLRIVTETFARNHAAALSLLDTSMVVWDHRCSQR